VLNGFSAQFTPRVQWLSQVVTLDATAAIYDFVHGRFVLGDTPQKGVIEGINFDTAVPLASRPEGVVSIGAGLSRGQFEIALIKLRGIGADMQRIPALDGLIRPEDLSLELPVDLRE
jgi:hypothetical protein